MRQRFALVSWPAGLIALLMACALSSQTTTAPKTVATQVVETELNRFGFYPNHVTVSAGTIRLQVRNRSGPGPHSLVFAGSAVAAVGALPVAVASIPITLGVAGTPTVHWKQDLDLAKGVYTITAPLPGKPDRKFTLTVN
jgi:plastocyanin